MAPKSLESHLTSIAKQCWKKHIKKRTLEHTQHDRNIMLLNGSESSGVELRTFAFSAQVSARHRLGRLDRFCDFVPMLHPKTFLTVDASNIS